MKMCLTKFPVPLLPITQDMLELGLVNVIVTTGAIITHALSEELGGVHHFFNGEMDDEGLAKSGFNRIYDTLEPERNLDAVELFLSDVVRKNKSKGIESSWEFCREIGRRLNQINKKKSGFIGEAFRKSVPIYIPALVDSELGLDLIFQEMKNKKTNSLFSPSRKIPSINPFNDFLNYSHLISKSSEIGIFSVGGGVPRNWAQQVCPFLKALNEKTGSLEKLPKFKYGVRICPEPDYLGGLSGCTYSEGVSWGKFFSKREGGEFAEVHCDATIAWPLLIRAIFDDVEENQKNKL